MKDLERAMEIDGFAELGLERRLEVTEEALQEAFRTVAGAAHPDAGGSQKAFERAEWARRILMDPTTRLRHWLELEGMAGSLRGEVSSRVMDLFSRVGPVLQRADEVIRARAKQGSALGRALLEPRVMAVKEELQELQATLEKEEGERVGLFEAVAKGETDGWAVARELAFLGKWRGQVRERFGGLW